MQAKARRLTTVSSQNRLETLHPLFPKVKPTINDAASMRASDFKSIEAFCYETSPDVKQAALFTDTFVVIRCYSTRPVGFESAVLAFCSAIQLFISALSVSRGSGPMLNA
jgi:hypothetical protein